MNSDKKFLIYLLSVSILLRVFLDLLYIYPPEVPHDFYAYIGAGKAFLSGTLYNILESGYGSRYGVLFAVTMGAVLKLFGENFILLKLPSTLADLGTIVVFYYIIKNLFGINQAKYASIFYAFSYIVLTQVMEGQDDNIFMFFMMLSLYYILKRNVTISALFIVVSAGFKPTALVLIPPVLYYIYRTIDIKSAMKYAGIVIILMLMMLLPFGMNAFFVYSPAGTIYHETSSPVGDNYFTLYHYLDYYFNYGINSDYTKYVSPTKALKPFTTAGLILIFVYFFVYRLKNPEMELIRNTFMIMFVGVMLAVQGDIHYIFWYLPFIIALFVNSQKVSLSEFKFRIEWIGIVLLTISILINASIYKWDFVSYTTIDRLILLSGSIMAGIGTLFLFDKLPQKYCLSMITFWYAIELQVHSYVLKAFDSIIPILANRHYAWGILSFTTNVMLVIALTWLFILVHKATRNA